MFCLPSPRMGGEKYIQKEYTKISVGIGVGVEEIQNMMSITDALKFWQSPLEMCTILHPMRPTMYYKLLESECVTHAKTTELDKILTVADEVIPKILTEAY